jgi:MoaA/NifB/PqqE/SkfB family radical SAM enzyme
VESKQKELYSSFKAAYHLDKLQSLRNGEIVFPTQIQVDLTNKCNHDCVYCFYHGVNERIVTSFDRKATLPFPTIIKLIDEMVDKKIPAIQITGGGEPLLYPQFTEVMDYLNKTNLEMALVTNGSLLKDSIIDRLHKLSWIRVSVDAATKDTYEKTQHTRIEEFPKVIENIQILVRELKDTVIGISFVINPINYKEIYPACKLYKELGVHNVRLSVAYTDNQNKLFEPFMDEMLDAAREARKLNDDNFRVFDLGYTHIVHLESKKKYSICGYGHLTAAIEANGAVRPCCTMKGLPHSNFGDINNNTFEEIWFGETRRKWLEKFDANKCILCWMDDKNEFIEYIVSKKKPAHVNFV